MTPVSKVPKRYVAEISAAMLLYMAALFGRVYALKFIEDPFAAKAVILSPILPILLMAIAAYRFYRGIDEYQRLRLLKIFALSAGITIIIVASWSFLQDIGAPPLAPFAILGLVAVSHFVISFLFKGEDLSGLGGSVKTLVRSFIAAGVLSAVYLLCAQWQGWPAVSLFILVPALALVLWLGTFVIARSQ